MGQIQGQIFFTLEGMIYTEQKGIEFLEVEIVGTDEARRNWRNQSTAPDQPNLVSGRFQGFPFNLLCVF